MGVQSSHESLSGTERSLADRIIFPKQRNWGEISLKTGIVWEFREEGGL